jgi:ABC-type transport system substrate-binding protein
MNNLKINRTYRQAINYAIDYDKIVNQTYNEATDYWKYKRLTSIIPPGISYQKDCDVPTFNITKSRQILIDAGFVEGYGLDEYSTEDDWKNVAESDNPIFTLIYLFLFNLPNMIREEIGLLIKDNLKDIGICVNLAGILTGNGFQHPPLYYFLNRSSEYDLFLFYVKPNYSDPSQIINLLMSNTLSLNFAQVNDSWLQLAMDEALTITNEDDRKAIYYDIQDYIATDLMPYAFIANSWSRNVRANYVNTQPNPIDKFYIFPFSWHGVNTSFNDPYLELWCNLGSPPVLEF